MNRRILSSILVLGLALGLLVIMPVTASAAPPAARVWVDADKELNAATPFLVGGTPAASGTLGSGGCTAQFDPATGTLTLHNHNGSWIHTEETFGAPVVDLTIKLIGSNTINHTGHYVYGIKNGDSYGSAGGATTITADTPASLAITVSSTDAAGRVFGITGSATDTKEDGGVTIAGKAAVSITASGKDYVYGIRNSTLNVDPATDKVRILGDASLSVRAVSTHASYAAFGIITGGNIIIDTTGDVTLDCSGCTANGYGMNCDGRVDYRSLPSRIRLNRVGTLVCKWSNDGAAVRERVPPERPVPADGYMLWNAAYFTVTEDAAAKTKTWVWNGVYPVTVTNGIADKATAAAGETVNIAANEAPAGQVFDGWTATGVSLASPTSASTSFTMPAGAVTLTANYKPAPIDPVDPVDPVDTTNYIKLWGKTTGYVSNFLNWLLCIVCFGWIWMAF
jgi:uncharacterized repeat protein (TIGR02543 family)